MNSRQRMQLRYIVNQLQQIKLQLEVIQKLQYENFCSSVEGLTPVSRCQTVPNGLILGSVSKSIGDLIDELGSVE